MPANVKDKDKWEKAKKKVQEQGKKLKDHWSLVQHIYQQMGGTYKKKKSAFNIEDKQKLAKLALKYKDTKEGKKIAELIKDIIDKEKS